VGPRVRAGRCNVSSLDEMKARIAARAARLEAAGLKPHEVFQLDALSVGAIHGYVSPEQCLSFRLRGLIDTRGQLTDAGRKALETAK
jgi:hypothetical protein